MSLDELRNRLDAIDAQLVALFAERMDVCREVALYKKEHGLAVLDAKREEEKIRAVTAMVEEEKAADVAALYETIFALSKDLQARQIDEVM